MKFTKELINTYAENLMFRLDDDAISDVIKDLIALETRMEYLNKTIDLTNIEIMSHPFDLNEVNLREDESNTSLDIDFAFRNTKKVTAREIEVPRVVN